MEIHVNDFCGCNPFYSNPLCIEATKKHKWVTKRLKEIRKAIDNENISYSEIMELQEYKEYIDDVVLAEWAGISEEEWCNKLMEGK